MQVVIPSTCNVFDGGSTLSLKFAAGDDSGEIIEVPIDETGSATVEVEGVLEIEKFDFAWCFLDSEAANAAAQIVIGKGEQAKVEILSCGPRPLNWAD